MDYERKYNNIVSRMQAIMESETRSDKFEEVIKWNFPELAESEDERIRKALIELVKYAKEGGLQLLDKPFNDVSMDTMLAWLEKQKSVYTIFRENNIAGSEAMTVSELVAELKCDNLQLRAELAQVKKQIEKLTKQ